MARIYKKHHIIPGIPIYFVWRRGNTIIMPVRDTGPQHGRQPQLGRDLAATLRGKLKVS